MNYCKIVGTVAVGLMFADGVVAAPITGTFVGALDGSNTLVQAGGSFSSATNAGTTWFDRTGGTGSFDSFLKLSAASTTSATGSGGYQPGGTDANIVTTITGLAAGQSYDVYAIYTSFSNDNNVNMAAGFSAGSTTQLSASGSVLTDEVSNVVPSFAVYEFLVGSTAANGSGEIEVFINTINNGSTAIVGYNGLSYAEVPEPGSFALLGLGVLALVRRRR